MGKRILLLIAMVLYIIFAIMLLKYNAIYIIIAVAIGLFLLKYLNNV